MRWGPRQIQMLAEGGWERRWRIFLSDAPLPGGADECIAGGSTGEGRTPHPTSPDLQLDLLQIDGGAVLTRQHAAASRVDKRSAALLTRPAGAELSLFFDPAAPRFSPPPPPPLPPRCSRAALFYCRLCLFDISLLLLLQLDGKQAPQRLPRLFKDGSDLFCSDKRFQADIQRTKGIFSLLNTTSRKLLLFIQEN